MKQPHPGHLTHIITIGSTVNILNDNGYPEEVETITCRVRASVEDASGKWFYSADAESAQRGIRFVIRWRADVQPGMWVDYAGSRYTVEEIGEFDFRRRYMQLKATRVEGVV
ncbi:MAG: phage head closure protein [Clostridia bacterium]|nr:phage head closure protein [Clostridia bacterium]